MKPRLDLSITLDSEAFSVIARDKLESLLLLNLDARPVFHQVSNQDRDKNTYSFDAFFNTQTGSNNFKNQLVLSIIGDPQFRTHIVRAVLRRHMCSHEDTKMVDCKSTNYSEVVLVP